MRVALDTNVLAYAEGVNGASMKQVALDLVRKLPASGTLLPVQVLGELFNSWCEKLGGRHQRRGARFLAGAMRSL